MPPRQFRPFLFVDCVTVSWHRRCPELEHVVGHQPTKDLSRVVVHKQLCCPLGAASVNFFYTSFPVLQYGSWRNLAEDPG